jgi:putative hydrolase of the HAD superfamily
MPSTRFIDRYQAILLDVCSTIMFDHDRFGPQEDFSSAYAQLGGNLLSGNELAALMRRMYLDIVEAEKLEVYFDPFPSLRDFLLAAEPSPGLAEDELRRIEAVFALHECGRIPHAVADAVLVLSETHPLGILSNIWSTSTVFEAELARARIKDLFQVRVWSTDYGCIKPAERLFWTALEHFDVPLDRVLHVGDTFSMDVYGAKRLGIHAAWVNASGIPVPMEYGVRPDIILRTVSELLAA